MTNTISADGMMPYAELLAELERHLARAQALDSIELVRDLYAVEVDEASRALKWVILHPDHEANPVSVEVMEEINARMAELAEVAA